MKQAAGRLAEYRQGRNEHEALKMIGTVKHYGN
jgi:hypothetical protein